MADRRRPGTTEPSGRVPRLLSLRAVAEQTTIPRPTWYTLVARGEIPAVRIGRSVRIDERDLLAWIAAHRERAS